MPAASFDPSVATQYGALVAAAYGMYTAATTNPTPTPPTLPGYEFLCWVQMRDFLIVEMPFSFYGFVARSTADPTNHVLAIRGTEKLIEWIDDFLFFPVPWTGFGNVAHGFDRIYQTMRIVHHPNSALAAHANLTLARPFEEQVAAVISAPSVGSRVKGLSVQRASQTSITATGHSLGAALATLYVAADSRLPDRAKVLSLYTFASPKVGDSTFAQHFDALGLTSWRVVNLPDHVPQLPPLGFDHVATEKDFDSGTQVRPTIGCWHSLGTYLHLLDPVHWNIDNDCTPLSAADLGSPAPIGSA